jgi:hypothetical protein
MDAGNREGLIKVRGGEKIQNQTTRKAETEEMGF